jgi:rhamnulokinase
MSRFYVACDVGAENGRVSLGTLERDVLTVSEVRRFSNVPVRHKNAVQRDIGGLYQEILEGLRAVGAYDEPADGISCSSWADDYLLFEPDGSLITPACPQVETHADDGMRKILAKVPWEKVYEETGIPRRAGNTLFQLATETSRRLKRAGHLLSIADGFNYLLAGVPRLETSLASATQLYDPVTRTWSERLLKALGLPNRLLPPVVEAGTTLGPLRVEIATDTRLEDAQVVASCSHDLAAALAGLPVCAGESWAFLRPGASGLLGTQLDEPIINEVCRELSFTNQLGYGGKVCFYRQTPGLSIFEECQSYWQEKDGALDEELLSHLAGSATPFESLINPADPRFLTPGDMPLKIQAFCKETEQPVPRKPGPIYRCILESLALHYRKLFREMEYLTTSKFTRLYLLDGDRTGLLNHFIANALQVPVVLAPPQATAIGNVVVQALALGHLKSLEEARQVLKNSFKLPTISPHATVWDMAFDRFSSLGQ